MIFGGVRVMPILGTSRQLFAEHPGYDIIGHMHKTGLKAVMVPKRPQTARDVAFVQL